MITVKNCTYKNRPINWDGNIYNADIEKNKSIRIYGTIKNAREPYEFSKTFKIGDLAEYDSYNLKYLGTIVAIGEKTVSIKEEYGKRIHRLKLWEFSWRNYDFDIGRVRKDNAEESMYI